MCAVRCLDSNSEATSFPSQQNDGGAVQFVFFYFSAIFNLILNQYFANNISFLSSFLVFRLCWKDHVKVFPCCYSFISGRQNLSRKTNSCTSWRTFISFKFQEIEIHRFGVCEICVCTQKQRLSMASNSTRIAFTLERTGSLGSWYIGDHSSWYLIDWQIDRITHRWALRERTANIYSAAKLQTPTSGGMEVTFSTGDTNDSYVVKLPSARKYTHTNVLVAQKQKETIFRNNSLE